MKHKVLAIIVAAALALSVGASVYADAGGGPGSNNGCPGHQPPPPPGGGCGH